MIIGTCGAWRGIGILPSQHPGKQAGPHLGLQGAGQ